VKSFRAADRGELNARRRRRLLGPGVPSVAVIGGGVAGLSVAHRLLSMGSTVTVVEDRDVTQTASWVAAGLIEPIAGTRDRDGMAREMAAFSRSMQAWQALARTGSPLISRRRVVTVSTATRPPLPWAEAVEDFHQVPDSQLPARYADGEAASFVTYVVETSRWLMDARAGLLRAGVRFVCDRVENLGQLPAAVGRHDAIVNASGLGAARLADDPTMYRGDGHVIRVTPVPGVTDVFVDETRAAAEVAADPFAVNMLYIIPRRHDVVIGGTLWDNPDVEAVPAKVPGMAQHLLALAADIEPRLADAMIVSYRVGARPRRRDGVRVQLESAGPVPVVHCYGQGGSGWTLAPALAEQTATLLAGAVGARRQAV
jgi:D-amino-acid oxidase